jgi:integrase
LLAETSDPNFERRLDEITEGMDSFIRAHLLEKVSRANTTIIIDYIQAYTFETNPKNESKQVAILTLKQLSEFHKNVKSFRDMTREDILAFLNRLRKSDEEDPLHHWIGTYNNNVVTINRFFKWLYYPQLEPPKRPKPEPMQNVGKLRRKEKTIYKDSDLWQDPDCNRIIFKYVTSVRDRAFHALMLDTSCRPKELIGAKIKDLEFKDKGYNQKFAYLWVVGKNGQRNKKLLVNSLPYLRDLLNTQHPRPEDPNAYILCGNGKRNLGRKLKRHTYTHIYIRYRKRLLPSLLKSPEVPEEDKEIIREKILTKPIIPYILRHTSLTEKGQLMGEYELRMHAGWTITSDMPQRYLHFRGNESVNALMKAQGIVSNEGANGEGADQGASTSITLRPPIICSNCKEPNKSEAKFCSNPKCGMVLRFEAYIESKEEAEDVKKELAEIKAQQKLQREELEEEFDKRMDAKFEKIYAKMMRTFGPRLRKIKDEKKRTAEETKLLWDAGVAAEVEYEQQLEEEQEEEATKRAAAVNVDDPIANNIDACELLETVEE